MSPAELIEIHNDPKEPSPGMHGHRVLSSLPDEAITTLTDHAGAPLVSVELRHLGGELGRGSVCHGAANWVQGEYALFAVGIAPDAQAAMAVDAALTRLTDALRPVGRRPRAPELHRPPGALLRRLHRPPPARPQGRTRRRRNVHQPHINGARPSLCCLQIGGGATAGPVRSGTGPAHGYGVVVESVKVSVFAYEPVRSASEAPIDCL